MFADDTQFVMSFIKAVQRLFPDRSLNSMDLVDDDETDLSDTMVAFVNDLVELEAEGCTAVVVVDDSHELTPEAWDRLAWLVDHLPRSLHIVVVSRMAPPLPLARLRARRQLSEVDGRALAFGEAETVELVERYSSAETDLSAVAVALQHRTEGWVAGLLLGLVALDRGADPESLLARFGGAHGSVAAFLLAEVLDRQSAETRRFLQLTSILGMLEPDVCDAVTERDDSHAVLRELATDHLFITPLEDIDGYRYHPLLAELLRHELHADVTEERSAHGRASQWYDDHGRIVESIHHAHCADDYQRMLESVVRHAPTLRIEGHRADIGRWLSAIPEDVVLGDPDSAVDHCAALLLIGRNETWSWVARVKDVFKPLRQDLRARVHLFNAVGFATRGFIDEFWHHYERWQALRPLDWDDWFEESAALWSTWLLTAQGRHSEALDGAIALLRSNRRIIVDAVALSAVAGALHAADDSAARVVADDAIGAWREQGEPDLIGMVDALCARSAYARAEDDMVTAEELAYAAVAVNAEPPAHMLTVRAWLEAARFEHAAGRPHEAAARLHDIKARARLADLAPAVQHTITIAQQEMSAGGIMAPDPPPTSIQTSDVLTRRELTILRYLESHLTFPEIGIALHVSRNTVKTHVQRIYRKLGVSSRSAAITNAYRRGLLSSSNGIIHAEDA